MSSSPTETRAGLVDVTMPQMGVSVAEGTVVAWSRAVGDEVVADETVCEISTDKIDTEVPAPASGALAEVCVGVGETVAVGTVLARIAAGGDLPSTPAVREDRVQRYSPVVQRIAAEHGVDLSRVRGTGRDGRVRKQDVLAFVAAEREPAAAEAGSATLSPMRRAIGAHMKRSLDTAATCTTWIEADMGAVEAERARRGVTALPILARAVVEALRAHPALNATFEGDRYTRHDDVNLGIAVSLGEDGLIVPVIHRAQQLSVAGLAERISDAAARARAGELTPDDVHGGTFTITNPGQYGSIMATPIINQPQVAILDLEAIVKRPVVVTRDGVDMIAIRPTTILGLSWDHRALDGAQAAQFLAALRRTLEGDAGR